jgi:ABC-type Na+ efflux pump permease subunit
MKSGRLRALFRKELLEVSRNRMVLFPVVLMTVIMIVLPFIVALIVPALSGNRLSSDRDFERVSRLIGSPPGLTPDARVQVFLFQQFLLMFLLTPITGAMSMAAHSVIGEKKERTLEPLLSTPLTTAELLVAKVLGALAPTMAISLAGLAIYCAGIAVLAAPGVLPAMINARTLMLIAFVGPAASLVALQSAIVISSRVNDARTAQQFGVLIVLPMTGLLVAQFTGRFWLSAWQMGLIGAGLLVVWFFLTLFSVAIFDRETILTRWK